MTARELFWAWLAEQTAPRLLEIGTRGWGGAPPVHHRAETARVNPSANWLGCDAQGGDGVDVVADAHTLSATFAPDSFDGMICVSTLEHVARPWVAAAQMAAVVRPGGMLWVETHQSFPVHGYPNDYYRFTTEGLREVFIACGQWGCLGADYSYPAKVYPTTNHHVWNYLAEAWLNVGGTFRRVGK